MAEPTERDREIAWIWLRSQPYIFDSAAGHDLAKSFAAWRITAREEGRREAVEECAKIADEVRREGADDGVGGVWRLACSEISQRIRHGEVK